MQTLKDIVVMLEEMRPTLERAKLSEKFQIFGQCDKLPGYVMEDALTWITAIYNGTYAECRRIRNMQPESLWAKYETWGDEFAEHRECVLYAERLVLFKHACRNRPLIFRHNKCLGAMEENNRKKPKNKAKKVSSEEV